MKQFQPNVNTVDILARLRRELYAAREDRQQAERMVVWATRRLAWSKQLLSAKRKLERITEEKTRSAKAVDVKNCCNKGHLDASIT